MSGRYLTDLAAVLRAAGLNVIEQSGWQQRARSSGGYASGRPLCVMWHHTASGASTSAKADTDYMSHGASAAPIANIMIARNGDVWVLAAGATNTNGDGVALQFSRGTVPAGQMNTHAIGMEIQNTGVGQAYSVECVDAAMRTSLACAAAYGLAPADVAGHWDYSGPRKIDPATAAAVQGPWRPRSVNGSGSWSLADLRAELNRRAAGAPPDPQPPSQEDDVSHFVFESQTSPREYNAMFFGTGDAQGRTIELQWSGNGDDPAVQARVQTMLENFGPARPLLLVGIRNNRLHPKHRPQDIVDSLHQWTDQDFAP